MAVYEELRMEVVLFDAEDVIVTSNTCTYEDDPGVIYLPFVPANP